MSRRAKSCDLASWQPTRRLSAYLGPSWSRYAPPRQGISFPPPTSPATTSSCFSAATEFPIHLYLFDTPLEAYATALIQAQYLAIAVAAAEAHPHTPAVSDGRQPSRSGSTRSLRPLDAPIALVHELMATSLVPALAEQGIILMTAHLWRNLHDGLVATRRSLRHVTPIGEQAEHFDQLPNSGGSEQRTRGFGGVSFAIEPQSCPSTDATWTNYLEIGSERLSPASTPGSSSNGSASSPMRRCRFFFAGARHCQLSV